MTGKGIGRVKIRATKINETLKELLIGILLFDMAALLIGVWFVDSPSKYIVGMAAGTALACFGAIHMYHSIERNLEINIARENAANAYSVRGSMVRYGVILIVFVVLCLTDVAYPLAVFLGIMGLKAGAYLQPFTHKYLLHRKEKNTK